MHVSVCAEQHISEGSGKGISIYKIPPLQQALSINYLLLKTRLEGFLLPRRESQDLCWLSICPGLSAAEAERGLKSGPPTCQVQTRHAHAPLARSLSGKIKKQTHKQNRNQLPLLIKRKLTTLPHFRHAFI